MFCSFGEKEKESFVTPTPVVNVIIYFFISDDEAKYARYFVLGKLFQLSQTFASKAGGAFTVVPS